MKYPEMRRELINYLLGLSDPDYQKNCWIDGICPAGVEHDEFDYAVHFLFDDTDLCSDAKSFIGVFLKDEKEANLIQKLCEHIEVIFDKYGTELSDEEYINCLEWGFVVTAAKEAYLALLASSAQENIPSDYG